MKQQIITDLLEANKLDAILLYSPENRYWYSRFHSSLGFLLITKANASLFLDGRYITAARNSNLKNVSWLEEFGGSNKGVWHLINQLLETQKIKRLGVESEWITLDQFDIFKKMLKTEIVAVSTKKIRMVKDEWEINNLVKACEITDLVYKDTIEFVQPNLSEKEIARFVADSFLKHGADKLSFDTIVASGENGAKPHAVPSDKKVIAGELITLDMGCFYKGYASDQTRTFSLGKVKDPQLKEIYDIVYESQTRGINSIKPGVTGDEIHKICFDYIESKGYGQYFTHGTGHGVGLEIHEQPNASTGDLTKLLPGMVITVEPGIYIPGLGGVRIEDDVLVTKDGHKVITTSPREFTEI